MGHPGHHLYVRARAYFETTEMDTTVNQIMVENFCNRLSYGIL